MAERACNKGHRGRGRTEGEGSGVVTVQKERGQGSISTLTSGHIVSIHT